MKRTIAFAVLATATVTTAIFYWYEIRPSRIRSTCEEKAVERAKDALKARADLIRARSGYVSDRERDLLNAADKDMYFPVDRDDSFRSCVRASGLQQ